MLHDLEAGIGLDVVVWLQDHGNILFDTIAKILNFTGRSLFFLVFLPYFYWSPQKRLGIRAVFGLLITGVVAVALKDIFNRPRPFVAYPDQVKALFDAVGKGFPSGDIALVIVTWGIILAWFKVAGKWWGVYGVYVLLVAWSRVYAGVHFPHDVVAGAIVGTIILGIYIFFSGRIAYTWTRMDAWLQIGVVLLVGGLTAILLSDNEDALTAAGSIIGAGLGVVYESRRIRFEVSNQQRLPIYIVGMLITLVVFVALKVILPDGGFWRVLRYGVVAGVATAGYPLLFTWYQTRENTNAL